MEWTIKTPARVELCGPSQAGKSTLLLKLIGDDSVWDKSIKKVAYASPSTSAHDEYLEQMQSRCDSTGKTLLVCDKIPSSEELQGFAEGEPLILILDDLLGFASGERLTEILVMDSHHMNCTVLFCVQTPFFKSSRFDLCTASRNLTARIVLYQVSDWLQYQLISCRLFPEKKSFLIDCLTEAKSKYGLNYVFCNLHPFSTIPRQFMCCTAIFADERERFGDSPLFFDLKNAS